MCAFWNVGLANLVARLAFLDEVDSRGGCDGFGSIGRTSLRATKETYSICTRWLGEEPCVEIWGKESRKNGEEGGDVRMSAM